MSAISKRTALLRIHATGRMTPSRLKAIGLALVRGEHDAVPGNLRGRWYVTQACGPAHRIGRGHQWKHEAYRIAAWFVTRDMVG